MNFNEICERSGLPPEAVRFYTESKLLSPLYPKRSIPDEGEFAEQEIPRLQAIANLRRLDFSIDDIRCLLQFDPNRLPEIAQRHRDEMEKLRLITINRIEQLDDLELIEREAPEDLVSFFACANITGPLPRRDNNQDEGQKMRQEMSERKQDIADMMSQIKADNHKIKKSRRLIFGLILLLLLALGWIIAPIWIAYLPKPF